MKLDHLRRPGTPHVQQERLAVDDLVTFESVCNDVRRSVAAWSTELHILRDEPDQLLLYFLRAPSKNPQA